MTGKNKLQLLLLLLAVWCVSACNKETDKVGPQGLTLSSEKHEISRLGGSFQVTIEVGAPWISKSDEWLSVSPENGAAGKHTLTVTAEPQGESTVTEGKVVFSLADGTSSRELRVSRGDAKPGRFTDSLALVALYNATDGENWTTRWNLKRPMKNWPQVLVEEVDGEMRVTKVMPQGFGLKGTIPEDIKYMDKLRYFSVEDNKVSGTFPEFFCDMKQLELLNLAKNNFNGEIPATLFDLPKLIYLILKGNRFSGKLPENIGNCKSLQTMEIQVNDFEGEIPRSFSQLVKLRYVQVGANRFHGALPDFSAMDSLIGVEFAGTAEFKTEPLPQADQQTLERKVWVKGGFTGPAPHFKNKPLLEKVLIYENNLTSSPKFTNCPKLSVLYIGNNPIQTLDPSVTRDMPELEILNMPDCGLERLPDFVNCPKLKFLVVHFNKLKSLPESISTLSGMEEFLGYANELESIPEGISGWKNCRHILIGYNKLKALPAAIWSLPIYSLKAPCNEITSLPNTLMTARHLNTLHLDCNKLQGTAQPLTTLLNAKDIRCSRNNLSGDFPEGFGKMTGLEILTLDDNQLTGTIAGDISKCTDMRSFHLYNNQMSGKIPSKVIQSVKWCSWEPAIYILPQKEGFGFDPFDDPCK